MTHAKIKYTEDKIPDITNMATKNNLNTETEEFEGEMPSITNLATKTALNAIENVIPIFSNLVKKTGYNTKINEIEMKITDHDHFKYSTAPELTSKNLTSENFAARLK